MDSEEYKAKQKIKGILIVGGIIIAIMVVIEVVKDLMKLF